MRHLKKYKLFENLDFKTTEEFCKYLNDKYYNIDNGWEYYIGEIKKYNIDISEEWFNTYGEERNILWYMPRDILYLNRKFAEAMMDINPNVYDRFQDMFAICDNKYYQFYKKTMKDIRKMPKYEFYFDTQELGLV